MIKKITIKNFKSIETLELVCNENFNVIIGENNIGKTTILKRFIYGRFAMILI